MGIVPLRSYSFCIIASIFEKCSIFYEQNITSLLLSFLKNRYFCIYLTICHHFIYLFIHSFHHILQICLLNLSSNLPRLLTRFCMNSIFYPKYSYQNFLRKFPALPYSNKSMTFLPISGRILLTPWKFCYKIKEESFCQSAQSQREQV